MFWSSAWSIVNANVAAFEILYITVALFWVLKFIGILILKYTQSAF